MACGIDSCKVEGYKLLHDFFFSDLDVFVALSFGLCLSYQFISFPLLIYVVLNEIFLRIIFKCHSFV